jgi:hypothetical protein
MQLNEAVLKMEVEKLRFELQSRDRCIRSLIVSLYGQFFGRACTR